MYEIIKNEKVKNDTYLLEVKAPLIAKSIKPGEFIIIMVDNMAERIPMAVYDINGDNISILYDVKGYSTNELKDAKSIFSIIGPLGNPSKLIEDEYKDKKICFIVKGTGIASVNRIIKALKENNTPCDVYTIGENVVDGLIILDEESVSNTIKEYDVVYTVGSFDFMEDIVLKAKETGKEVFVSLSPLMLDGVGLCGACRVLIDGKVKFACMDGPEFDGTKVDFDSAKKRINLFKTEEGRRYLKQVEGDTFQGKVGGDVK